jgi:hypothetical protein
VPSVRERARLPAAFLVTLGLATPGAARADACATADLLDAFPPNAATSVPTNATLTAHYATNAQFDGETVTLKHGSAPKETVDAVFDETQGLLSVTPVVPLVPGDTYVVAWPGLRGIDSASRGKGETVTFTAGDGPDDSAPVFDGLMRVSWDAQRERDDCTSSLEDRFAFDLEAGKATDDSGTESLALVIFQTKGPRVDQSGTREQVQTSPLPKKGETVRVNLPIADAEGNVCFAALVRDLTGKVSSADREACTHTTAPPFFYGCSVARGAAGGAPLGLGAPLLFALSLLARRWHRRAP